MILLWFEDFPVKQTMYFSGGRSTANSLTQDLDEAIIGVHLLWNKFNSGSHADHPSLY
jgi:hypothetical protein